MMLSHVLNIIILYIILHIVFGLYFQNILATKMYSSGLVYLQTLNTDHECSYLEAM